MAKPALDPAKATAVKNVTLVRDRVRITLLDGTLQFARPIVVTAGAEGRVIGAAFRGRGRIEVTPPNALEAQQLRLLSGQDSLAMEFTEAALAFSDDTFAELSAGRDWTATADASLGQLYAERLNQGEDLGAELFPRLYKSLLSSDRKRTAFFSAELKTDAKGWIRVRVDALKLEDVDVGRWGDYGPVRSFDTWMSFSAGGGRAADAYRDPFAREDFLIRSYRINATVTAGAELLATTRVNLDPRVAGERVLLFELDSNLRLASVKDPQGNPLPFFQPRDPKDRNQSYGDYVAVVLPEPTKAGTSLSIDFEYTGKRVIRKVGSGNFFCQSYGWYPTRPDSFAGRADFELNFRSPKKFLLVATGLKENETQDGDWTISTWKSDLPLAVAGFAFGDYKLETQKVGATEVAVYANRQPDDFMNEIRLAFSGALPGERPLEGAVGSLTPSEMTKTMGIEMANTLRVFENYFGPYPYKRLAITNIPYSYGQGWPMLIYLSALSFLDSTQRNTLGLRDHTGITDFFRAHESSHQWWGHRVGWKSYHDQWISEGFAQFSGNLYVQFRQNEKEYLNRIRKDREELLMKDEKGRVYEQIGPVWMGLRLSSADSPGAYGVVAYNKGGLILHMLRRLFWDSRSPTPDARFIALMRDFCATYHNKAASTEDFKAIVEKHMLPGMDLEGNQKMDWFFRQYVYGMGVPQYTMASRFTDAGEGKWMISATVSQSGVPDGWLDAVPIYVQHSGGKIVRAGFVNVRQRETPFEFLVPFKPEKLILNYNEDILAIIK